MPKMKSKSGAANRFKLRGSGSIKRSHAYMRHILTKKSTNRNGYMQRTIQCDRRNGALRRGSPGQARVPTDRHARDGKPHPLKLEGLKNIVSRAAADISAAGDPASLENAKARYLGKSGELSGFRATLGSLSPEDRRVAGGPLTPAAQRDRGGPERRGAARAGAGAVPRALPKE